MSATRDEAEHAKLHAVGRSVDDPNLRQIGHFEIEKKLGSGGMGTVFLVVDVRLKRRLALKVLPPEKAVNPILVRRFKSEAEKAAQLKHENIISVYDAGEVDGFCYIAMEYVDGIDVHELVSRRGVLPAKRSIDILKQTARALEHAHQQGIVHRDVKPSNLMIRRDGVVKLADMGLARSIDDSIETGITRAGTTVGTVDFMSPEQARDSKSADARSDIYSLGCTWYHMLTGSPPFPNGSLTNKLRDHAQTAMPDPRDKNPNVPEGIIAVMNRMVAKDPQDRYQSFAELLEDLAGANLSNAAVSEKIFAALEDEEKGKNGAGAGPVVHVPLPLPPKNRNRDDSPQEARSFWPAWPVWPKIQSKGWIFAGLVFVAMVLIVKLASIAQNYGAAFDSPVSHEFDPYADSTQAGAENVPAPGAPTSPATVVQDALDPNQANSATKAAVAQTPDRVVVKTNDPPQVAATKGGTKPGGSNPTGTIPPAHTEDPSQVPAWAEAALPTGSLTKISVRSGGGTHDDSALNEALGKLPAAGGVIELAGNGPFLLKPVDLELPLLSVQAVKGFRPLVVMLPAERGSTRSVLRHSGATLHIEDLDFLIDARDYPSGDPLDLLSLSSGNVILRNCTFTLRGTRSVPTTVLHMTGHASAASPSQNRILFDKCLVRGGNLRGIQAELDHADIVVRQSLFVTGQAPMLDLQSSVATATGAQRLIRFFDSTVGSRRNALHLTGGSNNPPATALYFYNSVVAAPEDDPAPQLLFLDNWPASAAAAKTPYKDLKWESQNSLFLGWKPLVQFDHDSAHSIEGPPRWRHLWKDNPDTTVFQGTPWPSGSQTDPASLPVDVWSRETLAAVGVQVGKSRTPGCDLTNLARPELPPANASLVQPPRPAVPPPFVSSKSVEVDLTKQDLGKVISSQDWPDGTTFVASGFGNRTSSPISNHGKSLQIVFEQVEGAALSISPRAIENSKSGTADDAESAFIRVAGGSLEIVNGAFNLQPTERQSPPAWFLYASGGSFALNSCRVQCPAALRGRYRGVIRWTAADANRAKDASDATLPPYARLEDTFIVSSGTIFEADLREQAILLRNSVLVSSDDVFAFNLERPKSHFGSGCDLDHCTLSARGTFFKVSSKSPAGERTAGLTFFVRECVFAPPIKEPGSRATPRLLTYTGSLLEEKRFDWWEQGCGYSPELDGYLSRETDSTGSPQDFETEWRQTWGMFHIQRALVGPNGVLLKDGLAQRAAFKPAHFELNPQSQAVTWDEGNGPIGALISSFDEDNPKTAPKPRKVAVPKGPPPKTQRTKRPPLPIVPGF